MKRILSLGFLLMGFSFTVTQGLLIRELLVAFFGNELSIGLILGNWLLLEAVGSGLFGGLADRWKGKAASFATLQVLFAIFLPLCLYAAYSSRSIAGAIPGEGVGLIPIFYSSLLILTPLALIDGAMFAFGCRAYAHLIGDDAPSVGWVYVYEALGAIVGGIVFTFILIPFMVSLRIILLLSGLNLLSAALIVAWPDLSNGRRLPLTPSRIVTVVLLIASLGFLLSPQTRKAQHWAASRQWPGYNLVYSENSAYGNVAVVEREAQYTFYSDGIPIITAPVPDVTLTEEIVHLPMLFIPKPRRALVLSGGVGGVLRELAKYPFEQIDYAELDPLLIGAVRQFPTRLTVAELGHHAVKVEHVDGRMLVRKKWREAEPGSRAGYHVVIVNLPFPSTLQLNRFYTEEFLLMVRGLLAEDGILVVGCPGSLTYMSDELRDLNRMTYFTLRRAFAHVRPIPGETTLWLASHSDAMSNTPLEALVERWAGRDLTTQLLTAPHIVLKIDQRRLDWFWTSLAAEEAAGKILINRDLHPVGLLYGLSYWNALFSPRVARVFKFTSQLKLWTLGLPVIGLALVSLTGLRLTGRGKGAVLPIAIATTGFTGMTANLIIVFAFQTLYGYVYHWIALLTSAFMAGLSLGGLLMIRRLAGVVKGRATFLKLELGLVLYWTLLPIALIILYSGITHPLVFTSIQWTLLLMNVLAGFLVGSQFPLANKIWLAVRKDSSGTAGILYASDLAGAFLGSIVVSVVLIPVLGIVQTCLLAAVLKLSSLLMVLTLPSRP